MHIGSTLTGLMYLLPPVLKRLHTSHPGIDLLMTNSPTSRMVEAVSCNEMDIGLVTLPVEDNRLAIMPLRVEPMVAILPAATRKVPKEITPDYVAAQFLVLETGAVSDLVLRWLSADRARVPQASTRVSEVEAVKVVVGATARHGDRARDVGRATERRHHHPATQSAADADARAHPPPQQAGRYQSLPDRARRDHGIVEYSGAQGAC